MNRNCIAELSVSETNASWCTLYHLT
jgi:hypothetical protein